MTIQSIIAVRLTTVNHAFASALSVADSYDEEKVDVALRILGQDSDSDLRCAYCDKLAETWDHIYAIVQGGEFSGHGHQINNLIPCCKDCNSKKGNKNWETFLIEKKLATPQRINRIKKYISFNASDSLEYINKRFKNDKKKLNQIKQEVLDLLKSADVEASIIRDKIRHLKKKK